MIPLAGRLQELDHNIFFGAGDEHLTFLRKEFPGATYIEFPGFRISYSRYLPQYLTILLKSPVLVYHSVSEHFKLKKIIRDYSIDIVISDNRIGLWNKGLKSIFVSHQLRIRFPKPFRFLEFTGVLAIRWVIRKYTYCFVPDMEDEINLSGELSHGMKIPGNVRYIGILSRLWGSDLNHPAASSKHLIILSGPEPQRSIFEQAIRKLFIDHGLHAIILEGKPSQSVDKYSEGNIEVYSHPDMKTTRDLILGCDRIICRGGYTTIMELISLGKSAILVPTFGQTEQEYLAEYLSGKGWFSFVPQKELGPKIFSAQKPDKLPAGIFNRSSALLDAVLSEVLEDHH